MATKAEQFRYERERTKPRQAASPRPRKVGGSKDAGSVRKTTLASRAAFRRESSAQRPSRKSTRKAANRVKASSNLTRRQIRRAQSPAARAARASNA